MERKKVEMPRVNKRKQKSLPVREGISDDLATGFSEIYVYSLNDPTSYFFLKPKQRVVLCLTVCLFMLLFIFLNVAMWNKPDKIDFI